MTIGHADFGAIGARHPTGAAVKGVSVKLGLKYDQDQQDWERFHADPKRTHEFLTLYCDGGLNDDERFCLMELILASARDGDADRNAPELWQAIMAELNARRDLHEWSVWDWSGFNEETGQFDDDYPTIPALAPLLHGNFRFEWARAFPNLPANAALLRQTVPHRWVRFHSLPDSKRYPETPGEMQTIIARYKALAAEVLGTEVLGAEELGDAKSSWMVAGRFETVGEQQASLKIKSATLHPQFGWRLTSQVMPDEDVVTYAGKSALARPEFDDLLGQIARYDEGSILWFSPVSGEIFAPYDGGCDLFLANTVRRDRLLARFADWRPVEGDL